ncbi:MAG: hypothetical protein C0625_15855 [Arcobacter sp.]|nr:MAG: hypothetical protein C0625_15855 [Arcobacter sp.]
MTVFDYQILENSNKNLKKNQYLLTEENFSSVKFSHVLNLYNNQYREVKITSDSSFENISKGQYISFVVNEVLSFSCELGSSTIFLYRDKKATDSLIYYWLYHTFFPILLTFENRYYFLHAGAVEIDFKPVLFVANSFGGKSTLTDFFMKKGHAMISDDKVASYEKDEQIFSVPSYPYHRPYRKMEDLGLFVENFVTESKVINCIFNLEKSDPNSDIIISEIFGIEKFKVLRYSTDIDLPIHRELRFKALANIANKVQIYNITIPWDLDRLKEVYQTIIKFIKGR